MSIQKRVPKDSRLIQTVNTFDATFNVPTVGAYNFGIAANTAQPVTELRRTSVYLLSKMSFSCNIDEGDFLEAVTTTPQFLIKRQIDRATVWYKPIPIVSYIDGVDFLSYATTKEKTETAANSRPVTDQLTIDFTGVLDQTAALVGRNTIRAQVTFNFYEVIDSAWVKMYRDGNENKQYFIV